jgi:hypothetical protein
VSTLASNSRPARFASHPRIFPHAALRKRPRAGEAPLLQRYGIGVGNYPAVGDTEMGTDTYAIGCLQERLRHIVPYDNQSVADLNSVVKTDWVDSTTSAKAPDLRIPAVKDFAEASAAAIATGLANGAVQAAEVMGSTPRRLVKEAILKEHPDKFVNVTDIFESLEDALEVAAGIPPGLLREATPHCGVHMGISRKGYLFLFRTDNHSTDDHYKRIAYVRTAGEDGQPLCLVRLAASKLRAACIDAVLTELEGGSADFACAFADMKDFSAFKDEWMVKLKVMNVDARLRKTAAAWSDALDGVARGGGADGLGEAAQSYSLHFARADARHRASAASQARPLVLAGAWSDSLDLAARGGGADGLGKAALAMSAEHAGGKGDKHHRELAVTQARPLKLAFAWSDALDLAARGGGADGLHEAALAMGEEHAGGKGSARHRELAVTQARPLELAFAWSDALDLAARGGGADGLHEAALAMGEEHAGGKGDKRHRGHVVADDAKRADRAAAAPAAPAAPAPLVPTYNSARFTGAWTHWDNCRAAGMTFSDNEKRFHCGVVGCHAPDGLNSVRKTTGAPKPNNSYQHLMTHHPGVMNGGSLKPEGWVRGGR